MAGPESRSPRLGECSLPRRCLLGIGGLAAVALVSFPTLVFARQAGRTIPRGSGGPVRAAKRHAPTRSRRLTPHPPPGPAQSLAEVPRRLYTPETPERAVALYNPRTGEKLQAVYWYRGKYLPEVQHDINYLLRDYHTNETTSMDPHLLDLLHAMGNLLEADGPFYVTSGYRSPATNASLQRRNRAVAEHSMHITGQAADIYLPGRTLRIVREAAVSLQGGGVGFYPYANFVHVDTGPLRYW